MYSWNRSHHAHWQPRNSPPPDPTPVYQFGSLVPPSHSGAMTVQASCISQKIREAGFVSLDDGPLERPCGSPSSLKTLVDDELNTTASSVDGSASASSLADKFRGPTATYHVGDSPGAVGYGPVYPDQPPPSFQPVPYRHVMPPAQWSGPFHGPAPCDNPPPYWAHDVKHPHPHFISQLSPRSPPRPSWGPVPLNCPPLPARYPQPFPVPLQANFPPHGAVLVSPIMHTPMQQLPHGSQSHQYPYYPQANPAVAGVSSLPFRPPPPPSPPARVELPSARPPSPTVMDRSLPPLVIPPANPHIFQPRSPLLVEYRTNRSRDWKISDVQGHIVEFSRDLFASRFIQDSIVKKKNLGLILAELSQPDALVAVSMDSSGNYVIQRLLENATEPQREALAESLIKHIVQLSLDTYGCRVIQRLLDLSSRDFRARIAKEAEPHVLTFAKDANANHVVQKMLEVVPCNCLEFMVPLLKGHVANLARDTFGCRVIQRSFYYLPGDVSRPLVEEFLPHTLEMVTDPFGNYVVQKLLECGYHRHKLIILQHLQGNFLRCAQHKYGSVVCEKALTFSDTPIRQAIIDEILVMANRFPKGVHDLMVHQYGNYVLQQVFAVAEEPQLSALIWASKRELANARRAKSSPGHRNKAKQLDSIEKLLRRECD